jgi:hypothetical protein
MGDRVLGSYGFWIMAEIRALSGIGAGAMMREPSPITL